MRLRMTSAAPMFNEESSREIRVGEGFWCQPAITLHHMDAKAPAEILERESSLNFSRLLLRDIYAAVYRPDGLPSRREDWDNMSDAHEFRLDTAASLLPDGLALSPNQD